MLAAGFLAAGCGGGTGNRSPETERAADHGYRACDDRLGEPLKASDVVSAFEAEGFTMYSLPESRECDGAGIDAVAAVSNQRSVTDGAASDTEGWVTCDVSRDTVFRDDGADLDELYVDLDRGPASPVGRTKAAFVLANVSCLHYPPRVDADEWTGRAHAAMKRLERQLAGG